MKLIDRFRHIRVIRTVLYAVVGFITYPGLALINKVKIEGTENLFNLPKKNVLFVSNHQTYFADVIAFVHIFCAVKWRKHNRLGLPFYLLNPFTNVYMVAAAETMNTNWLTKLFKLCGTLTVKRTWRAEGQDVSRERDSADTQKIDQALHHSWVITFPQGTTTPFAPGRKGTAFIIKKYKPIVVPIVINGFSEAFDKTGLKIQKRNVKLSVEFKDPLQINYDDSTEDILQQIMEAIEQVGPQNNEI
jgi:1-acyl-sn-glycerol-3-phosphate acyltransferase